MIEIGTRQYQDCEIADAIAEHERLLAKAITDINRLRASSRPMEQTRSARTTSYARLARACEHRDRLQSTIDQLEDYANRS